MMALDDLDQVDRGIINAYQGGFPVVERPYEPAAAALAEGGIAIYPSELLARVRRLDEEGVFSRFGPLLNADAIGGKTTLAAADVPDERYEEVASIVNEFHEVAHNYERDHELNMWFVVSVLDPERVEPVLDNIAGRAGVEVYDMPKRREFHLGAIFPVDGPFQDGVDLSPLGPNPEPISRASLTVEDRELVAEVQDGYPHTLTPYADVADRIGVSRDWVLETINRFLAEGKIRRIGAIPNHYALGYTENAMTVWDVPDDRIVKVGQAVGALPFVTHCYERPRHEPMWPYNLFAMVHGRTEQAVTERIDRVSDSVEGFVSDPDREVLYSTRVLKKAGLRLGDRVREGDVQEPPDAPSSLVENGPTRDH